MTTARLSELTEATAAVATDLMEISQDQGDTTYLSKKITKANALSDYAKLDGSNQPFTGAITVPNLTDSGLTITRVPFVSTGGLLVDCPCLTYSSVTGLATTKPIIITGSTDVVQEKIIANATQTTDVFQILASDGIAEIAAIDVSGNLTLKGGAYIRPTVDSTSALKINKADGTTNVVTVDTTNARVGIGTSAPSAKLHIVSSVIASQLQLATNLTDNNPKYGGLTVSHYSNTEEPLVGFYGSSLATENVVAFGGGSSTSNSATRISFYTAPNTTTLQGTERIRITSDGLVGIGNEAPNSLLDVSGGADGVTSVLATFRSKFGLNTGTTIRLANSSVVTSNAGVELTSLRTDVSANTDFIISSYTNTGTPAVTEKLRILGISGNVGIGTTTPSAKLHITGSSNAVQLKVIANSTQTANILDIFASDGTTAKFHILGDGNVGIGTTAPTLGKLHVTKTESAVTSGSSGNIYGEYNIAAAGTSTAAYRGFFQDLAIDTANLTGATIRGLGQYAVMTGNAGNTIGNFQGTYTDINLNSKNNNATTITSMFNTFRGFTTGTITTKNGVYINDTMDGGTITTYNGIRNLITLNSGNIGTGYGYKLERSGTGVTPTNWYGIYLDDFSGATNNYGLYVAGVQKNYFGGAVGIGTTAPTSKLHLVSNYSTPAATSQGLYVIGTFSGGATDISGAQRAVDVSMTVDGSAGATNAATGLNFSVSNLNTGTMAAVYGTNGTSLQGASSGTITLAAGVRGRTANSGAGTVTTGAGLLAASPSKTSTGNITNQYGLYVNNQGLSGSTVSSGIYVDAQSGATNSYAAIFAGGNVGIGTTNPTAKIHIAGTTDIVQSKIVANATQTSDLFQVLASDGTSVIATIDVNGNTTFKNAAYIRPVSDSTTALNINRSNGTTNVLTVDTTNSRIGIGATGAPVSTLEVQGAGTTTGITLQTNGSDGTARFSVLDNGTVTVSPAAAALGMSTVTKGLTVNSGKGNATTDQFNAKGTGDEYLILTDVANNRVGIGMLPTNKLDVNGAVGINNATGQSYLAKGLIVNSSNGNATIDAFNARGVSDNSLIITDTLNNRVGIGTATPQGKLDISSTTGGFIVPRMTTTEKNALTAVNGMIIYDSTLNKFQGYENGSWQNLI